MLWTDLSDKDKKEILSKRKNKSYLLKKFNISKRTLGRWIIKIENGVDFSSNSHSNTNRFCTLNKEDKEEILEAVNSPVGARTKKYIKISKKHKISVDSIKVWGDRLKASFDFSDSVKDECLPSNNHFIKGTSTLFDTDGKVKQQWVKTDLKKQEQLENIDKALKEITKSFKTLRPQSFMENKPKKRLYKDKLNIYTCNDAHFGALMDSYETGDREWNLEEATKTLKGAFDYLYENSPNTEECIFAELGDLMEVDNLENRTRKSGNILSTDARYHRIFETAYMSLIYGIERALTKHKTVRFISVGGNHDTVSHLAIQHVINAYFSNEPRVIVENSPRLIKYHQFGENLFMFAHGDGVKMNQAGETMAYDCEKIFSQTRNRYGLFGHNHKDSVVDTKLIRCESFRNLAPANDWASAMGMRRGIGTMNSITYDKKYGEISRQKFNVNMID